MKSIYLDDKYHLITISDEAYEQITQIINAYTGFAGDANSPTPMSVQW